MDVGVLDGHIVDVEGPKHDGGDVAGKFLEICDDSFVVADVFVDAVVASSALVVSGVGEGTTEQSFTERSLKIS